jgi:cell wall-associated NlpC family hydrolase
VGFLEDLFGRLSPQRPPVDVFGGVQPLDAFGDLMGDGSDALPPITPFGGLDRSFGGFSGGLGSTTSSSPAFWQMPALGGGIGTNRRGAFSQPLPLKSDPVSLPSRRAFSTKPPTQTTGTTAPGTAGDIWGVIDEETQGDPQLAQALKLAVQLESGGRADAVGDQGQSYGFYQIYQPAHGRNITPEQSRDPRQATRYRLAEFRQAKDRVTRERPGLWESDPMSAAALTAFYAQRPAQMYGAANVQNAWQTVQQRQAAPPPGLPAAVAPAAATPQAAQGLQAAAIAEATKHIGMPYLLAGQANNPKAGAFDCSGLIQWSFGQAGRSLPRVAQGQYDATDRITANEAQPGDLVFFTGTYDSGSPVSHVGIYLGGNKMLQAGSGGVGYADLSSPYWQSKLYGWGRVR